MNKRSSSENSQKLSIGLPIAAIVISLVAFSLSILNRRNEIVYVDSKKLVNGFKGMQDARREFETKAGAWKANLDTLKAEVESKIKEYDDSKSRLSDKERALMEELIHSKQEQFINYQQVVSEKISLEDKELTSKVLAKVNDYMKSYGEQKGYQIIMAATQYGNIVYAEEHTDITQEVLDGLNLEYTK
ncbi:MAG TPA: OmpH family outer membrane protein [Cyclobacteriaceae bacterium]|nr:OmpH family outer membrane protein [Cyclobacteriaceae bacterium]